MESLKSKDGKVDVVSRLFPAVNFKFGLFHAFKKFFKVRSQIWQILTGTHSLSFNFCYFGSGLRLQISFLVGYLAGLTDNG